MKKITVFVLFGLMSFCAVSAQNYTLQSFYSQPAVKENMDNYIKNLGLIDDILDYSYRVKDNTMTYIYKFTKQQTDIQSVRENIILRLRNSLINFVIETIENESGVSGIIVQYIYYNKDGSEIYNQIWMK